MSCSWGLICDVLCCAAVCAALYLQVVKVYDNLGTNVERADLWRYLALHKYGGVYAGKPYHH